MANKETDSHCDFPFTVVQYRSVLSTDWCKLLLVIDKNCWFQNKPRLLFQECGPNIYSYYIYEKTESIFGSVWRSLYFYWLLTKVSKKDS